MIQTRYYITGYNTHYTKVQPIIQQYTLQYPTIHYFYFYYTFIPACRYSWRLHRQVWESRHQPTSRKEGAQKGLTPHPAHVPQREMVRLQPQQVVQAHLGAIVSIVYGLPHATYCNNLQVIDSRAKFFNSGLSPCFLSTH